MIIQRTKWYPVETSPVRLGMYEVKTKSRPYPHKIEYDGDGWNTDGEVLVWRGITKDKYFSITFDTFTKLLNKLR